TPRTSYISNCFFLWLHCDFFSFFFNLVDPQCALPSFPTRRSSDLSLAPGAAALAASLASYFTGWIAAVAVFFAGLPGAKIPWPAGPLGVGALITFTLGAAAGLRRVGRRRTWQA